MKEKNNRLSVLKNIILHNKINNQEALLKMLEQKGYKTTQATLSRDLKSLKVGKVSDGDLGYFYTIPNDVLDLSEQTAYTGVLKNVVVSMGFSDNVCVIKTRPGLASTVAVVIDSADFSSVLGCVAGDDCIIVILKENSSKEDFTAKFKTKFDCSKIECNS